MAPQNISKNTKLLIALSIVVAIIAVVGIAALSFNWKGKAGGGATKVVKEEKVIIKKKVSVEYPLEFEELKGAMAVQPLTYPQPDGSTFLFVNTLNGTREIWTIKGMKVIGRFVIKGPVVPVFDVRKGESAVMNGKLLLGINGTLYAIRGNESEPVGKYNLLPGAKVGIFVKKGKVYAWLVKQVKEKDNTTVVYCLLYDVAKGKLLSNYTFNLGKNVTAANPLPDLLDGDGCLVLWVKRMSPIMYYYYKGKNGEAKGSEDLLKMKVATFAPLFLEDSPYHSKPYFMLISLGQRGNFVLRFYDILKNSTVSYTLPGLYNFVGVGDYFGKGYVGNALFLVINRNGMNIYIFDVNGNYQNITVGKLSKTLSVVTGLYSGEATKRVFGLGNFTNTTVVVKSNVGELKFKVINVPQKISSMFIVINKEGERLCYTAIVNPTVGGLTTAQQLLKGKVYLANGCWG